jgi:nucleoside-diphosphate-sugar epimerase
MTERLNLVTGAAGFTGSYVVRDLIARGQKVIVTDLPRAFEDEVQMDALRSFGVDFDHPNIEVMAADLLDKKTLAPLFERPITHIFHVASLYDYSASLEILRKVNVDGTRNFLDFALELDTLERFIHWSTCGVFGKPYTAADGHNVNVPFDENSPSPKTMPYGVKEPDDTHLVNDYSISKWEQEQMVWKEHRDNGLPVTVVRPAPIYGPGSDYGHGGIILAIAQGWVPGIPSDAKNYITTSVHVEDIAGFAVYAADHDDTIGEDYNVVDNSIISYHEFLHYIALLTGRSLRDIPLLKLKSLHPILEKLAYGWTWLERAFSVPRIRVFEIQSATYISSSYWLSNRKSIEAGYEYKYPEVREGLKDTVAWFRELGWLTDPKRTLVVSPGGSKANKISA